MQIAEPFARRYSRLRLLGRGGFGAVYRAWDEQMERDVALKLLKQELAQDDHWRARFRQEATAVSRLQHPNVTVVFDRGECDGQPYLVMEFIPGDSLAHLIETGVPLTDPERLHLLEQLCDGLHYAHQHDIVHRDIKPVNLMVCEPSSGRRRGRQLKILDFGIAKIIGSGLSVSSGLPGFTPNYVSPEQILNQPMDGRSDMFAVGAVAYELFTRQKPFGIKSQDLFHVLNEIVEKIVKNPHPPLTLHRPDIDRELVSVIDRALAKSPGDRFRDLDELGGHFREIRERLETSAPAHDRLTVSLTPAVREAVLRAQRALDADDPSLAVHVLEAAMPTGAGQLRDYLEPWLAVARSRQRVKSIAPVQDFANAPPRLLPPTVVIEPDPVPMPLPPPTNDADPESVRVRSRRTVLTGALCAMALVAGGLAWWASGWTQEGLEMRPAGELQAGASRSAQTLPSQSGPGRKPEPEPNGSTAGGAPSGTSSASDQRTGLNQESTGHVAAPPPTPPTGRRESRRGIQAKRGSSEESSRLADRVREFLRRESILLGRAVDVSLSISTRPSPFSGRGLTADYVATVETGDGTKAFQGQHLGFAELTVRNEIVEKLAPEISAYLATLPGITKVR